MGKGNKDGMSFQFTSICTNRGHHLTQQLLVCSPTPPRLCVSHTQDPFASMAIFLSAFLLPLP